MNLPDLFSPLPATADDTWATLTDFVAHWWRAPGASDGVRSVDLDQVERRLRVVLPVAVRNAYCFFGRYPEITQGQINLLPMHALDFQDDVLVLCADEEERAFWGVRRVDLSRDDPPVVMRSLFDEEAISTGSMGSTGSPGSPRRWFQASERFTAYFTENALFQTLESAPYINHAEYPGQLAVPEGLAQLSTSARVRSIPYLTLYGGDDVLLAVDNVTSVVSAAIAARTREAYHRAKGYLPEAPWERPPDSVHQPDYSRVVGDSKFAVKILKGMSDSNLLSSLVKKFKK